MKPTWQGLIAAITVGAVLVGWGISYEHLNSKADDGVCALRMAHNQKIDVECMKQSMLRIPVIESKIDKLLEKK